MPSISRRACISALSTTLAAPFLRGIDTREPAPRFRAKSLSGDLFTNESVKGKVVLIQFWTTWCPYCKRDLKAVESIGQDFRSEGLLVLAVNVAESKKTVQQYLKESPRSSAIIMMADTNLAAMFAVKSFPYYVAIDRNGSLAGTQAGSGGEPTLRRLLNKAGLTSETVDDAITDLQASPRRQ